MINWNNTHKSIVEMFPDKTEVKEIGYGVFGHRVTVYLVSGQQIELGWSNFSRKWVKLY